MTIQNMNELPDEYIWKDEIGFITKSLGEAANSKKLYIHIDSIPPQAFSTKYHSHPQQEEFFLILEGVGILRLNNEEYQVTKGDFIAKPAGQNIAHTFYNSSDSVLLILDVGTVESEDTCYYPDEDIYMHKSNGVTNVFSKQAIIPDWTSNPNKSSVSNQTTVHSMPTSPSFKIHGDKDSL